MSEYLLALGQMVVLPGDEADADALVAEARGGGHLPALVVAVPRHGLDFEFALDCGACGTVCAARDGSLDPASCYQPDPKGDDEGPPAQCEVAAAVFEVLWRHDHDDLLRAAHLASLVREA